MSTLAPWKLSWISSGAVFLAWLSWLVEAGSDTCAAAELVAAASGGGLLVAFGGAFCAKVKRNAAEPSSRIQASLSGAFIRAFVYLGKSDSPPNPENTINSFF